MADQDTSLKTRIERFFAAGAAAVGDSGAMHAFDELREALEAGKVRAAEPDAASPHGWRVNAWVKQGILLGFRLGVLRSGAEMSSASWISTRIPCGDLPPTMECASCREARRCGRRVCGGGVICAPPMYVNAGAYVDEGRWWTRMRWWAVARRLASGSI